MHAIRRATIVDGQIVDKKDHPGTVEVPQVSILLENERERSGVKTISRFATILVEEAIMTNDPVLWKTISDDIDTGDFDISAVHCLFAQNIMLASLWVTCISTSKSREHVLDMLVFFYEISKNIPAEVKEAISASITCQWKSFVNCLITVVSSASSRVKALFEILLKTSSPKHTTVLAVAKAVVDNPDFIDSHGSDIEKMILETLRVIMRSGYGDRRVLNAVGFLAGKVFEDNPTAKNMATLLCWSTNA